jgi:colanic acid biosynthesis glycosyl transferase WcaI
MNIVVLCPHFAPDMAPTGEVISAITLRLAARGHRLHVVTSLPWYRHHATETGWDGQLVRHQDTDWGRITRVHPFPTDKTNIPARALAFGGFTVLSAIEGALTSERPDVVLAMSPPITLGAAGWAVARSRRAPFVFNIQDVFPDVAIELGLLTNARAIAVARRLEVATYRHADAVTVLSDELAANVRAKVTSAVPMHRRSEFADRVHVIPNFVDTSAIVPQPSPGGASYRAEYGLGERTVVMYAGNVGLSQSLDLVVHAARSMAHRKDVVFVINGGGSARQSLMASAAGLDNLVFVDMQPRERLPDVLAAGDVHVVPLRTGLSASSVPSKLYSILAAGRPIVASVDPGTEVQRTVESAGAGLAVAPDDPEAFTDALHTLVGDPARRIAMGAAGRSFVEGWASPEAVALAYEQLFDRLIAERSRYPVGIRRP